MNLRQDSNSTRTLIAIDSELINDLKAILQAATRELIKAGEREKQLRIEADRNKLLTEKQAQEYLQRDADTLLYYRKNGMPYFKYGRDVWYKKGLIDDWLESGKVNRRNS
ncbi:hypothetical protein GO730_00715 [Spirosoma sp. HMF3257]|uniref:Helix-turn-helix domain-containing protein n=1 Tax=Spirosoma telluris TaxID=2183553 RepID=A0A327NDG5_9BACT|nr:hypothetical protein [Spirosoma telluris]RAI73321.1 hypothetical protein HMF3257_00695 [Spirosoma telluris]